MPTSAPSQTFADLFDALNKCYEAGVSDEPFCWGWHSFVGFAVYCAAAAVLTGNYSHTDRLWSITPVVYVWIWAAAAGFDARTSIMAALSLYWGARLSFNFWRKGGYSKGEEDYRWPVLRAHPLLKHPLAWHAFNVFFIAGYQHFLLFLIACPAYVAYTGKDEPLNWADAVAIVLMVGALALETVADQQQWNYQEAKYGRRPKCSQRVANGDYERGFNTGGLFRYSRHPNFFAEQSVWWSFFVFGAAALGPDRWESWTNWTLLAPVLLSLLFQGSTPFTESITTKKYPLYKEYQRVTSALLPLPRFGQPSWETGESTPLKTGTNRS